MRKEEILSEISKILLPPFEQLSFFSNKKKDNYIKKEDSFEFKFSIYISSVDIQHLTLSVINKEIEYLFYRIKSMYINQLQKEKFRKGMYPICNLTDWKDLYKENNLAIGKVWFTMYSSLDEIKQYREEYLIAMGLAFQWFEKCKNLYYVYLYNLEKGTTISLEMALCIKKFLGYNIDEDYEDIVLRKTNLLGWDKTDFKLFYNHLKNI